MFNYQSQIINTFSTPVSQTVLFMGQSDWGQLLVPTYVNNPLQAEVVFGGGPLVEAYRQAYLAGGRYIYLMRLEDATFYTNNLPDLVEIPFVYFHPIGLDWGDSAVSSLLDFAQYRGALGYNTHFVLGVGAIDVNTLKSFTNYFQDGVDYYGRYFSVVVEQTPYAAAIYSSLISSYPPQVSLTNKDTGLLHLETEYALSECNELAAAGYVTFVPTIRRGIAVHNAVTMMPEDSDYYLFLNTRVVMDVLEDLRRVDRSYLGLPPGASLDSLKLENAIYNLLESKVGDGDLKDFAFNLAYDRINCLATLELILVPIMAVRVLNVSTTIYIV